MQLRDAFVDLLLGGCCAGCARPGRRLCPDCARLVARARPSLHRPDPEPEGMPPTVVTGWYDQLWPSLLAAYKEQGSWGLAGPLAARLWPAVVQAVLSREADQGDRDGDGERSYVLVPMPSRPGAVRERGRDTTALLARRVSRIAARHDWSLPTVPALRVARRVQDSAGLGAAARRVNLQGAFAVRWWPGRRLRSEAPTVEAVLCDDLVTTGASLTEAARALRAAGVPVAGAVAVVATRRHRQRSGHRQR